MIKMKLIKQGVVLQLGLLFVILISYYFKQSSYESNGLLDIILTTDSNAVWSDFLDAIPFLFPGRGYIAQYLLVIIIFSLDKLFFRKNKMFKESFARVVVAVFLLSFLSLVFNLYLNFTVDELQSNQVNITMLIIKYFVFYLPDMIFLILYLEVVWSVFNKAWKALAFIFLYFILTFILGAYGVDIGLIYYGHLPFKNAAIETFAGLNNYLVTHLFYILYWVVISFIIFMLFQTYNDYKKHSQKKITKNILFLASGIIIALVLFSEITSKTSSYSVIQQVEQNEKITPNKEQEAVLKFPKMEVLKLKVNIDIMPQEGKVVINGLYHIKNIAKEKINSIIINLPKNVTLLSSEISINNKIIGKKNVSSDTSDVIRYILDEEVNELDVLTYKFKAQYKSYLSTFISSLGNKVNKHYTSLESNELFPSVVLLNVVNKNGKIKLSYQDKATLTKDFFLRVAKESNISLSTIRTQIAITSGYLEGERVINDRRYFSYKSIDQRLYFPIISANYRKHEVENKGFKIRCFSLLEYSKRCGFIAKNSIKILDYYTSVLGKLPSKDITIVQRPIDSGLSRTFQNLITLSSKIAFKSDLEIANNETGLFQLLAHEIAHLWFGHLLKISNENGSAAFSEGLSQFLSLSAIKRIKGVKAFELFTLRGERLYKKYYNQDKPLINTTSINEERFITYTKSSLLYYGLSQQVNEENFFYVVRQYLSYAKTIKAGSTIFEFEKYLIENLESKYKVMIRAIFNKADHYDISVGKANYYFDGEQYILDIELDNRKNSILVKEHSEDVKQLQIEIISSNSQKLKMKIPFVLGKQNQRIILDYEPKIVRLDPNYWFIDIDRSNNFVLLSK